MKLFRKEQTKEKEKTNFCVLRNNILGNDTLWMVSSLHLYLYYYKTESANDITVARALGCYGQTIRQIFQKDA